MPYKHIFVFLTNWLNVQRAVKTLTNCDTTQPISLVHEKISLGVFAVCSHADWDILPLNRTCSIRMHIVRLYRIDNLMIWYTIKNSY